jgi:hypothetical protein
MRIKPLYIILLIIVIPVLLVSYGPIKRKVEFRIASRRIHKNLDAWNTLQFTPITNVVQRQAVAAEILKKAALPIGSAPSSESELQRDLERLFLAFTTTEVASYKESRGLDLANSIKFRYDKNEIGQYANAMPPPAGIRKIILHARDVPGNGRDETPDAIHLLAWLYALQARAMDPNVVPQAIYCNGHWVSISLKHTALIGTNSSPADFLERQPNCHVRSYTPDFTVDIPDSEAAPQLLFSTIARLDGGFDAHPVAISLRWYSNARRWIPAEFAVGSVVNGIQYIW